MAHEENVPSSSDAQETCPPPATHVGESRLARDGILAGSTLSNENSNSPVTPCIRDVGDPSHSCDDGRQMGQ